MIKSIALGCLLAASTAFAGTAPSSKGVALPPPAVACPSGIAYNTIEADWVRVFNDDAEDADGANLELTYSPINQLYVVGSAAIVDDQWGFTAGAGFFQPLAERIHFVVEAGAAFEEDENAFYVKPHFRTKIGCVELHAGAKYYNFDQDYWAGFVAAYYEVATNLDLAATGFIAEDSSSLQVGLRYKF